ncbi:MAG: thioesterase family protein [Thermoguttaceae bacterium]
MSEKIKSVSQIVTEELLAVNVGSGDVRVFATPMMIALMEKAAALCAEDVISPGQTTVGANLNVNHTAPTPLGKTVTATACLTEQQGKKLVFTVSAEDGNQQIGSGTHTRYIVEKALFEQKAGV